MEVITESVTCAKSGEVKIIQYTHSLVIGHGSFGVVFQTHLLPSNEITAMKKVLQDKRFKNRELLIMKEIRHTNVVELKYYFYFKNKKNEMYLNLILEFVPETLYKASRFYILKKMTMPSLEIKIYSYQIFRALNYIHSKGICHRDIKPQNILINPQTYHLKLCDFGSAKILNPSEPNVSYICSRYYRAPELIFGTVNYTTKIDIWSVACVMAELILGHPLFSGDSGIDQLLEIIKILGTPHKNQIKDMNSNYKDHKFPVIASISLNNVFKKASNNCIKLLNKILKYSPIERLSSIECLVDSYFEELRVPKLKIPNYRKIFTIQNYNKNDTNLTTHSNNSNYKIYSTQPDLIDSPPLFDFNEDELSVNSALNEKLVPPFCIKDLKIKTPIKNINEFVPLNKKKVLTVNLD